jgi:hypothetical protein
MKEANMGDILTFPGTFRPELEEGTAPDAVIKGALGLPIRDLVYVARKIDGGIVIGFTHSDADAASGLLAKGVFELAQCEQVHLPVEEPTA